MMKKILIAALALVFCSAANEKPLKIAVLKYNGGGDWYDSPTSLPNLIKFCNKELNMNLQSDVPNVEVGSPELFNYAFVRMTGHGNVVFNEQELENLRAYLAGGGFLYVDDSYGMDKFVRPQLEKIFPGNKLTELPFNHPIFHQKFDFPKGLPKIHEHDGLPPQAFGIFYQGRLVVLYTYQTDLDDGWEDPDVHKDPEDTRLKALKMGADIIQYVFAN
ncbi:MAG TPA: DUF4159 domain-containing protein [Chitinophagales bacterium]|nr:DUF4159 domain-containing protein [Chitinophagales bacterium]